MEPVPTVVPVATVSTLQRIRARDLLITPMFAGLLSDAVTCHLSVAIDINKTIILRKKGFVSDVSAQ